MVCKHERYVRRTPRGFHPGREQSNNDAEMSMSEQRAASAFNIKANTSKLHSGQALVWGARSALPEDPEGQDGANQVQRPVHDAEHGGCYAGVVVLPTEAAVVVERLGEKRDARRQVQRARHQVEQDLEGCAREERGRGEGPAGGDEQHEGAQQAPEGGQDEVQLVARHGEQVHLAVLRVV